MNWLRRFRPALFILGAVLLIGSLLGARMLTAGNGSTEKSEPKTANPVSSSKAIGPIVLGTVDSDPTPVSYGLPPVLQTGMVAVVFVKDGQEIKLGDKLYEFDTSLQKVDLERAEAAVATAKTKVGVAAEGAKKHAESVKVMKQAVAAAERKEKWQGELYLLVKGNLETYYKSNNIPEAEWEKKLRSEDKLYTAQVAYAGAQIDVALKKAELAALEAADPQVFVKEAEAGVKQAEEEVQKARISIDLCTVKAKSPGTVERVTISPGTTLGISTREPALWLIPAGTRVVRAEVEADFAHKVGKDIEGKEVVVYDNTNPQLTYKGKVIRVGGTFLPKRGAGESLLGNDTRVLEAVVEVNEPATKEKPPLRVGQRVRVSLGQ